MKKLSINKITLSYRLIILMMIVCFSPLSAHETIDDERALYAISSLRCHLQQLLDGESEKLHIAFEHDDIKQLWDGAQHSDYDSLLQQAKYYYDHAIYDHAKDHLDDVWERLASYPNFDSNPFINTDMKTAMAPFLLPLSHPMKPALDQIFSTSRVTSSVDALIQAGFKILYVKDSTSIVVARHPDVYDYLFKIYPDLETHTREGRPGWQWLVDRCIGAAKIKNLIKAKNIKHFTVADKWLYPLPPIPTKGVQHPVILLATDMHLVSSESTEEAWYDVEEEELDELYIILSHGYGSNYLIRNIPFTKSGKFAFIDTEYPQRKINLSKVKGYIDPTMYSYWDKLVKNGKKKK